MMMTPARRHGRNPVFALALSFLAAAGGVVPAAAKDWPREIAGLRLGMSPPQNDSVITAEFAPGVVGDLYWVGDEAAGITHLILRLNPYEETGAGNETKPDPLAALIAVLGPPASEGEETLAIWTDTSLGYRYRLSAEDEAGGGYYHALTLEATAPERLCGPQDGFAEWFAGFRAGPAADDAAALAGFFRLPFVTDASTEKPPVVLTDMAALHDWLSDDAGRSLVEALRATPQDEIECNVMPSEGKITGYTVWLGKETRYQPLAIVREDGAWRFDGLFYVP